MKSPRIPFVASDKIFYGWIIVACGFVMTGFNGLSMQGFSTYLTPLAKEFGWSKIALSGPRAFTQAENALLGPINGFMVDKFGVRAMMILGVTLFGLGMVLFSFIDNLWQYYAVNIIMAIGTSFSGFLGVTSAINKWFHRKRTFALSLGISGVTFSGVVGVPLLVLMQSSLGWRHAALWAGLATWAIGYPVAFFMRESPEKYGLYPDGEKPTPNEQPSAGSKFRTRGVSNVDFTLKEALSTRTFWFVSLGFSFSGLAMQAISVHQFVHMEQGVGVSRTSAALVVTVTSIVAIFGRLGGGILGDRLPKHLMLGITTLSQAVSLLAFAIAKSMTMLMVFAVLYGISWGVRGPVATSLFGDYFGRKSFGKIVGSQMAVSSPLSIAGPLVMGIMADRLGNYALALFLLAATSLISGFMFFLSKPPAQPKRTAVPSE